MPSLPPETSLVAQNMKTGPDALGSAPNGSGSAKHEYGTRLLRYRPKRVRERKIKKMDLAPSVPPNTGPGAQKMKTGTDARGTAETSSEEQNIKQDQTPSVPPKKCLES
jgi:hypothetical protein